MVKNLKSIVITGILVISMATILYKIGHAYYNKEGFRGRGRGRRRHRDVDIDSETYKRLHRRLGGRHWSGSHRGYVYGPNFVYDDYYFYDPRNRYDNWWYNSWVAPPVTTTVATVPLTYGCKSGCANLGNDKWGCLYPGNGITQCQFAQDCDMCGDRGLVWWQPATWFY